MRIRTSILCTIIVAATFVSPCFANDGPVYSSITGNSVKLLDDSPIEMSEEDLRIDIHPERVEVSIDYVLRNTENTTHNVSMGFPELCKREDDRIFFNEGYESCALLDFAITADGTSIPVTFKTAEQAATPNINWHLHQVPFGPNEQKRVHITYWLKPIDGPPSFYYVLSSAAGWKNAIGRIDATVTFHGTTSVYGIMGKINPPGYRIDERANAIRWHFENLEPSRDDNIHFIYGQKDTWGESFGQSASSDLIFCWDKTKSYFEERQGPYESSHMGNHYGCKAHDSDPMTAWREGAKGNGIGEWILFLISESYIFPSGKTYHALRIRNGVATNRDSWQKNTRIRTLKIEPILRSWDYSVEPHLQIIPLPVQRITLADTYEEQILRLPERIIIPPQVNKIREDGAILTEKSYSVSVTLTVEDVYPGTLYSQASLSEINFLGFDNRIAEGGDIEFDSSTFVDLYHHLYRESVEHLEDKNIIQGYDDGSFRPDAAINRAEFTKIVMGALRPKDITATSSKRCLSDLQVNAWYVPFVCSAHAAKIITGYPDGTFRPEKTVNVAEAAKILVESASIDTQSLKGDEWYSRHMRALNNLEALPTAARDPAHLITRGEMAYMMDRVMSKNL
jgi:hypothetical protein